MRENMRHMKALLGCVFIGFLHVTPVRAADPVGPLGIPIWTSEIEGKQQWQEGDTKLPEAPKKENLLPFFVSTTTENRFFVDSESISIGPDRVVRYTLVIQTSGSATNTSYEGMRCETRERRLYALGRSDGSWSAARNKDWAKIQDGDVNRQYAALFFEYFCPDGITVANATEAKRLLRKGEERSLPCCVTIGR